MQRKLVQMGKHTLMAAVPSKWVKKHGLKKGDYVEFTEVENKLVATSTAEIYERKAEVHVLSPTIEVIWRVLQPAYTSGYDEVKITYTDKKTLRVLEGCLQNLIGFEIVQTGNNYVVVKSVSKQLDEEFPDLLRRTFLVMKQMSELMKEVFEKKDKTRLAEIRPLEFTVNKYTMFLKRIINRTGYKYPHYVYLIVTFLELASNHLEYIRKYYELHPRAIMEKEAANEYCKVHDLVNKTYDLHYNYSDEKFRWIAEEQPHFHWFKKIKDFDIKFNLKCMTEYLVQISRQIAALHL